MSAGQFITGTEGVILLGDSREIPCLMSWKFSAKVALDSQETGCMKSNGDGGAAKAGAFVKRYAGAKEASFDAVFAWQDDDDAGAAGMLRTTDTGTLVSFKLYPNDKGSGKRVISGMAFVSSVDQGGELKKSLEQTVKFEVDGEWEDKEEI